MSDPESSVKARFRALCVAILAEGRVPGPTELTDLMGWRGRPNTISGRYVKIRTEELERAGYSKDENSGRWVKP